MTDLTVPVAKQVMLMAKFTSDIARIRIRMHQVRYLYVFGEFAEIVASFGPYGRSLMKSESMQQRVYDLLRAESAYEIMSSFNEHEYLKDAWQELVAGMIGELSRWVPSPFSVATYEYKLKNFVRKNEKFRADVLDVTLRIGPVMLQSVGALVARNEIGEAEQELLGLLVDIEATVDKLISTHYPVAGAA